MVERSTEFIQLFLSDALAVSGQDLVLHLVNCSRRRNKIRREKTNISIKDKSVAAGSPRPLQLLSNFRTETLSAVE